MSCINHCCPLIFSVLFSHMTTGLARVLGESLMVSFIIFISFIAGCRYYTHLSVGLRVLQILKIYRLLLKGLDEIKMFADAPVVALKGIKVADDCNWFTGLTTEISAHTVVQHSSIY